LIIEAEIAIIAEREHLRRNTKDINIVDKMICENPLKPSEAMLKMGTNIYPKAEINRQISRIKADRSLSNLGTPGFFEQKLDGNILFNPSTDIKPILNFPYKPDVDGEGCVIQYQPPYKFGNHTPPELYYICVDPYAMDKDKNKAPLYLQYDKLGDLNSMINDTDAFRELQKSFASFIHCINASGNPTIFANWFTKLFNKIPLFGMSSVGRITQPLFMSPLKCFHRSNNNANNFPGKDTGAPCPILSVASNIKPASVVLEIIISILSELAKAIILSQSAAAVNTLLIDVFTKWVSMFSPLYKPLTQCVNKAS
jgi:hypothetical protein